MKPDDSYGRLIAVLKEGLRQFRQQQGNDGSCLYCLYAQPDDCPEHGWEK